MIIGLAKRMSDIVVAENRHVGEITITAQQMRDILPRAIAFENLLKTDPAFKKMVESRLTLREQVLSPELSTIEKAAYADRYKTYANLIQTNADGAKIDAALKALKDAVIAEDNRIEESVEKAVLARIETLKQDKEVETAVKSFQEQTKPKTKAEITRAANKKRDQEKQRRKVYEEEMIAAELAKARQQKQKKGCKKSK
jgi:hypothetical protein